MRWPNDAWTACEVWLLTAAIFYGVAKAVFPEEPGRNSLLRFFGRFVKLLLLTVIAVLILASLRVLNALTLGSFYGLLVAASWLRRHGISPSVIRERFLARVARIEQWYTRNGWKEPILFHKRWVLSPRAAHLFPVMGAAAVVLLLVAQVHLRWPFDNLRFAYPEAYTNLLRVRQLLHDTSAFNQPLVVPSLLSTIASLGAIDAMQVTRFLSPLIDILLTLAGGVATAVVFRSNWVGVFTFFLLGCYVHQSFVGEGLIGTSFLLLGIAFLADYGYNARRVSLQDALCAFVLLTISSPKVFPRELALILLLSSILGFASWLAYRLAPQYHVESWLPLFLMIGIFSCFPPAFPRPHFLEYEAAARQSLRIAETYPAQHWAIAAPVEQFSETFGMGQYEDLDEFVRQYQDRAGDASFQFPDKTLFIFVEKRPFEYFATEPTAVSFSILTDPTYRNYRSPAGRSSLELSARKLCEAYRETHASRVFYEDENLTVYDFSR
jgi:hypothetical protein